jgi:NAD-dependent deacetylase
MTLANQVLQAAALLREAKNTVAFTGAGISTPSGIPDFRSPASGLWERYDPMTVASIFGFRANPAAFYEWVYPLARTTLDAKPNSAHLALAQLAALNKLHCVITQNIDMLHRRAGSRVVYELHGHFAEATCTHCFAIYDGLPLLERFLHDREIPRCPRCRGVIKPNVILFGEQLPAMILRDAQTAARNADLMLVIGSSLEVAPASDIPLLTQRHGGRIIIINLESTPVDRDAALVIRGDASVVLPDIVQSLESQ